MLIALLGACLMALGLWYGPFRNDPLEMSDVKFFGSAIVGGAGLFLVFLGIVH